MSNRCGDDDDDDDSGGGGDDCGVLLLWDYRMAFLVSKRSVWRILVSRGES